MLQRSLILFICVTFMTPQSKCQIQNCTWDNTINVTNKLEYDGTHYSYGRYAELEVTLFANYTTKTLPNGKSVSVENHQRGCICKFERCVRYCCHPSELKIENLDQCADEVPEQVKHMPKINILINGQVQRRSVYDEFDIQNGVGCTQVTTFSTANGTPATWKITEKGELIRRSDDKKFSKNEYCLRPQKNGNNAFEWEVLYCVSKDPEVTQYQFATTLLEMISLCLPILYYAFKQELWHLHGNCLVCALFAFVCAYMLNLMSYSSHETLEQMSCLIFGHLSYFCIMSAFCWLSIIIFDISKRLKSLGSRVRRFRRETKFWAYLILVLVVMLPLNGILLLMERLNVDNSFKPGMGIDNCWLKTNDWSALIYHYAPMLLIMFITVIMYIMTFVKFIHIRDHGTDVSMELLEALFSNLTFNLWTFCVISISWLSKFIIYIYQLKGTLAFYIQMPIGTLQGLIILYLLVSQCQDESDQGTDVVDAMDYELSSDSSSSS